VTSAFVPSPGPAKAGKGRPRTGPIHDRNPSRVGTNRPGTTVRMPKWRSAMPPTRIGWPSGDSCSRLWPPATPTAGRPDTGEDAARTYWMSKPSGRVLVAVDDGAVVGTAEIHPNQPAAGSHVANAGFMVSPTASVRGVGRVLARRVLEVAAADGYTATQFNAVVETTSTQSGCGSRSASRSWPPSRKLSDILTVGWSAFTSCTDSCDSRGCLNTRSDATMGVTVVVRPCLNERRRPELGHPRELSARSRR
jgi:GNAT superfamily N-acetyltransferase